MPERPIALTLGPKHASLYLNVQMNLVIDEWKSHAAVAMSFFGLYADAEMGKPLLHYDFERKKQDGYPEAHLQVSGSSPAWEEVLNRRLGDGSSLDALHLPVGGRRYRPSLEDLVEMLITENLVDGREGWKSAVSAARDEFHDRQLRAAIRREPELAADALAKLGYHVTAPRPS